MFSVSCFAFGHGGKSIPTDAVIGAQELGSLALKLQGKRFRIQGSRSMTLEMRSLTTESFRLLLLLMKLP